MRFLGNQMWQEVAQWEAMETKRRDGAPGPTHLSQTGPQSRAGLMLPLPQAGSSRQKQLPPGQSQPRGWKLKRPKTTNTDTVVCDGPGHQKGHSCHFQEGTGKSLSVFQSFPVSTCHPLLGILDEVCSIFSKFWRRG